MSSRPEVWLEITHLLASPTGNKSGIGYYTENLIRALAKEHDEYNFVLIGNLFATAEIPSSIQALNLPMKFSRYIPGRMWNQAFKRGLMPPVDILHSGKPDLMVNFNFVRYPVRQRVKSITVVHDLAYEKYPDHVESRNLVYLRKFVPLAVLQSTRTVAVSQSTKRDLIEIYAADESRIDVVYGAVDQHRYQRNLSIEKVMKKYSLPKHYAFFMGNNEPRKNLGNLIRAFTSLTEGQRQGCILVIAGAKGWNDEELTALASDGEKRGFVKRIGYVEDTDAPALYAGARCFIFPSFYEGFGLPILEAMAARTPVITTRGSSMHEVAGRAALYINDPEDVHEMAIQISRMLSDAQLRKKLISMGNQRLKDFSWGKSARQLVGSIDKALS